MDAFQEWWDSARKIMDGALPVTIAKAAWDAALSQDVSIYEFGAAVGLSYQHIYHQIRAGKVPAKRVNGVWRIPRSLLDKVVAKVKEEANESNGSGN